MGTINTAEVAKKNPAVYVEMVQRKAELDLIALENSKQLSLMYLESYANENNLTQEEKTHLENMIERKVLLEAAKTEGGVFSKIVNAFKRLWQWLFGTKETEIKPEDMNNKVQPKFDLNDAEKYLGSIEGDMSKLSNCRTKADVDRNKGDIVKTVDTLKTITTTASTTYVTLSVVKGILDKIHGTMGSVSSMCEKTKESFEREMAKYNTTSSGSDNSNGNSDNADNENNKKLEELREAQKEVEKQYSDVLSQLTTLSTEIKRLIKEGTSDSEGKGDNEDDDDGKDKKPTDPDVQDMLDYTGGSSGGNGGSVGKDDAIKWINQYHYKYTDKDYNSGKVTIVVKSIPAKMMKNTAFKDVIKNKSNNLNDSSFKVSYDELKDIISKYSPDYVPGVKPEISINISEMENKINTIVPNISEVVLKSLYGSVPKKQEGIDFWHLNKKNWEMLGNKAIWTRVGNFCRTNDKDKFIKGLFDKNNGKNGGNTGYKIGLKKDQIYFLKPILECLNDSSVSSQQLSTLASSQPDKKGDDIKKVVKDSIGLTKQTDPDPCWY